MIDRIDLDVQGTESAKKRTGYYIAAKHSIGNIDLLANFMVARDTKYRASASEAKADDGAKAFTVGAVYNFSKRTNIGAYYAQVRNDKDGGYGMREADTYTPARLGQNVKGMSVRLHHAF